MSVTAQSYLKIAKMRSTLPIFTFIIAISVYIHVYIVSAYLRNLSNDDFNTTVTHRCVEAQKEKGCKSAKMSGQYRKISKPVANKKTLTPLLQLGNVMMENNRFAEELVSKEPGAPFLPGGVSHKVAANYYLGRDGRRLMKPAADVNKFEKKSEGENWGLKCPTPGTGVHWHREHHNEWPHLKRDGELNFLDKYDSFKK